MRLEVGKPFNEVNPSCTTYPDERGIENDVLTDNTVNGVDAIIDAAVNLDAIASLHE